MLDILGECEQGAVLHSNHSSIWELLETEEFDDGLSLQEGAVPSYGAVDPIIYDFELSYPEVLYKRHNHYFLLHV